MNVEMAHEPMDETDRLTDDFNPLPPETFTSSHADFARLRDECPVAHSQAWGGFWALSRYADVVGVLRDYQTFTTSVQNVVPGLAFTGRRPPLHLDPPEHTWYRRPLVPFFTTAKMQQIEPAIRQIAYDLWRPIVEAGGGEICAEFTHKLPGYVFAEFFNLSTDLAMRIKEVSVLYDRAVQRKEDELQKRMSLALYDIAQAIMDQRRADPLDPRDDPASALLLATDDQGRPLPDNLLLGTIRQLIVVGMIAPSVFIGTVVIHLAQHQDLQQRLREHPDLIPAATEEYLRLFTPYRGFARTAKRDVVIGERLIKKDEPIALVFASANRDETVFPSGDQFILDRPNIKDHVAFGGGPHQCAGAPLGRLMLQLTLEALLKLTKRIDVVAAAIEIPAVNATLGPLLAQSAPIQEGFFTPTTGANSQAALVARAPHPNVGKLLLNFFMTPQGQSILNRDAWSPVPGTPGARPSVQTAPSLTGQAVAQQNEIISLLGL